MKHANADPRLRKLKTVARSLKLWVLELVLWIAAFTDSRVARLWLRDEIRALRADIRLLLVGMVGLQLAACGASMPTVRDTHAQADARRLWRLRPMRRLALRGVKLRTLTDIKRALNDMEGVAARCVQRFCTRIAADAGDSPCAVCESPVLRAPHTRPEAADTS